MGGAAAGFAWRLSLIHIWREGKDAWARRERDRLQGILEVLFYNPEIYDAVKEDVYKRQDMYSTVETYRDEDISTEWLRVRGQHKVVFAAPSAMMRMQIA